MGYDARAFVAGAPDNAPASVAVADEPAASSTKFRQQRRPIDATDQGNVWAVSDPLAVVPPSGGPSFVDGGNGMIPFDASLPNLTGGAGGFGVRAPVPGAMPSAPFVAPQVFDPMNPGGGTDVGGTGPTPSDPFAGKAVQDATTANLGPFSFGPTGASVSAGPVSARAGLFSAGIGPHTGNELADTALSMAIHAAGIPTGMSLLSLLGLGALAPLGMVTLAPAIATGLGKLGDAALETFGVPTVSSTLASLRGNLNSPSESVRGQAQAVIDEAAANVDAISQGQTITVTDPQVANTMAALGAKGFHLPGGGVSFGANAMQGGTMDPNANPSTFNARTAAERGGFLFGNPKAPAPEPKAPEPEPKAPEPELELDPNAPPAAPPEGSTTQGNTADPSTTGPPQGQQGEQGNIGLVSGSTVGGGGGGGGGGSHICGALYRRGLLDREDLRANDRFRRRMGEDAYRGYDLWSRPLVNYCDRHQLAFSIAWTLGGPIVRAYMAAIRGDGSWFGRLVLRAGLSACRWLGRRGRRDPLMGAA